MYANKNNDKKLIDAAITLAEDERTFMAKYDKTNMRQVNIDAAHTATHKNKTTILQKGNNMGNAFSTATRRLISSIKRDDKNVQFRRNPKITIYYHDDNTTMLTYDSGAYGHYHSEKDRKNLGLPILRISAKKVGVANGGACNGKYVTKIPFPQFYNKASEADTFE